MLTKRYRDLEGVNHSLSKEIPPEKYEHLDLPILFRPRISIFAKQVDEAILECREDFRAAGIHDLGHATFSEPAGSADSLWMPDSVCDRLQICAYLNEYAMLHDHWVDLCKTSEEFDRTNAALALLRGDYSHRNENKNQKEIQAKFVYKMLATGNVWANIMMQDYKKFLSISSDDRDRALETLAFEDYMKFRREDCGATFFLHEICFCKGNSLCPNDLQPIHHIMEMAGHIMGLTNDYYSYEREVDEWLRRGKSGPIVNAITVLMRLHRLDLTAAKRLLYRKIIDLSNEYCNQRDEFVLTNCPGTEMLEILAAFELSIAGNALWHATSPRYTAWKRNADSAQSPDRCLKDTITDFKLSTSMNSTAQESTGVHSLREMHLQLSTGSLASWIRTLFNFLSCGYVSRKIQEVTAPTEMAAYICGQVLRNDEIQIVEKKSVSADFSTDSTLENETPSSDDRDRRGVMAMDYDDAKIKSYETTMDEIPDETIIQSFRYIASLPAGGARDTLVDALNAWYQVPEASLKLIREIVATIHNISLMLDDIEDNSPQRRGSPAAHMVFGESQTINAATFMYAKCSTDAMKLSRQAMADFFYELQQLHVGQGKDLYWTYHCESPTVAAYFECLEQKTGGLFRMISKMMQAEATKQEKLNITKLMTLLGRFYQLRDDYKDITDTEVKADNYNDLDQGSFTLPIIHALGQSQEQHVAEMKSMLQARKQAKTMSLEMKKHFLAKLKETNSIEYTKNVLQDLHKEMEELLGKAEEESGVKNWILKLMLHRLKL